MDAFGVGFADALVTRASHAWFESPGSRAMPQARRAMPQARGPACGHTHSVVFSGRDRSRSFPRKSLALFAETKQDFAPKTQKRRVFARPQAPQ